jgi:hypothetical protein
MRFIVEYNPNLSKHAERLIKADITPSMVSDDKETGQYHIGCVIDTLFEENQDEVFTKDIDYLKNLSEQEDVAYIEF